MNTSNAVTMAFLIGFSQGNFSQPTTARNLKPGTLACFCYIYIISYFVSNNYRGITISPVISKIFESLLNSLFQEQLSSDPLQFGFFKNSSCNHALFTLRHVFEHYVADNSTVNVCALDISKAFDRVDHFALLQSLMDRNLLRNWQVLELLCKHLERKGCLLKYK